MRSIVRWAACGSINTSLKALGWRLVGSASLVVTDTLHRCCDNRCTMLCLTSFVADESDALNMAEACKRLRESVGLQPG